MHSRFRMVVGLSYRIVSGLDEDSELISTTEVKNDDFNGLNFNVGLKIGLH